jgi:hypothetical protein
MLNFNRKIESFFKEPTNLATINLVAADATGIAETV